MKKILLLTMCLLGGLMAADPQREIPTTAAPSQPRSVVKPIWKEHSKGCFVHESANHTTYIIQELGDGGFPIEAVLVIPHAENVWKANGFAYIHSGIEYSFSLERIEKDSSILKRPIVHLFPRGSRLLDNNYPTEIIDRNPIAQDAAQNIAFEAATDYGGKHIDDLGVLLQHANGIIKGKFIIYGASLGGYMVIQALMHPKINKFFAAGISVSSFYGLWTEEFFSKGTLLPEIAPEGWDSPLSDDDKAHILTPTSYVEYCISNYKQLSKEELTRRAFPIDCADQIKVPLLVIHGENDYTALCSPEGARAFAEAALKSIGKELFTYVEIPEATHSNIYEHELITKAIVEFLEKHNMLASADVHKLAQKDSKDLR